LRTGRGALETSGINMATTRRMNWAVTPEKLDQAVARIVEAAHPLRIVLFGSLSRGDGALDSDVDLLVVERDAPDRYAEMVRLGRLLRGLILPVDLIVIGQREFEEQSRLPGTVYHAAALEGTVLYDAA